MEEYKVALKTLVEEFSLEGIFVPEDIDNRYVVRSDVSRPGLPLCGFFEYFEGGRIQIMGKMELSYLFGLSAEERKKSITAFLSRSVVCVVVLKASVLLLIFSIVEVRLSFAKNSISTGVLIVLICFGKIL